MGRFRGIVEYHSTSAEETYQFGRKLGEELPPNSLICFHGELAAGKTTLIKGLAAGAAQVDASQVQSPTFTYLNIY
ncbi:MAG: tRNA (adenosine(37)-N6)-threonylcarbamoyltransferase complex ATPase subunit type 1 TsaE, partial [Parachlamydia sp.]|nr:tRNA (adenosine(37)-N6)-threonylcarbamoyltransferase complex ATPase subunit type 1 TsaE [Parachlamydia sp.]